MISTKGRYALRVMIDLAEHQTGEYIPLKAIAQRQGISEKYYQDFRKWTEYKFNRACGQEKNIG